MDNENIEGLLHSDQENTIGHLAVDCVIFGFQNKMLQVLLVKRTILESSAKWSLPGGAVKKNENLRDTPKRVLKDMTNIEGVFLKQVQAFGEMDRVPGYRSISIAYFALINPTQYELLSHKPQVEEVAWFPINEVPTLPLDHEKILHRCLERLRDEAIRRPVGIRLLDTLFPLNHLQYLYEAIFDKKFDNRNFRKKVLKLGMIDPTEEFQTGVSHKAGRLYKFNQEKFAELEKKGIYFEI